MSDQLLAKVGHYYYRDQLTMAEIGQRLGISRHKVGRLLKDALDSGVVQIEIRQPAETNVELESRLEAAYGLNSSVVAVVPPGAEPETVKATTCQVGADFLRDIIQDGTTIGVGWGSTTYDLVTRLRPREIEDARVVQITGGNKWINARFDCQEVTRRLASALGVQPIVLHAPGIVDRPETRDLLMQDSAIAETVRSFEAIDVAVVGIGSLEPELASALVDSGYVTDDELAVLRRGGAIGDVFSHFIDDGGRIVRTEIYDRLITIAAEQARRIPTSIGIAAGKHKARAVAAAVKGGFLNTLIVDDGLAQALLELQEGQAEVPRKGRVSKKAEA